MTDCTSLSFEFPACRRRRIEADFSGGEITSNAMACCCCQADRLLGLTASAAGRRAGRRPAAGQGRAWIYRHAAPTGFALALGYGATSTTTRPFALISPCRRRPGGTGRWPARRRWSRFENAAGRAWAWRVHEVNWWRASSPHFDAPPEERHPRRFDATDDAGALRQGKRAASSTATNDHYCFLPLYVFCRRAACDGQLSAPVQDRRGQACLGDLGAVWSKSCARPGPACRSVFRGDGGFCRHKMLGWCERHGARLHRRPGQEQAAQPARRVVDGDGGKGLRGKRRQAAPVRTSSLTASRDLEADAPESDRAHRARSQGRQPALHRHQPGRRGARTLREAITARAATWRTAPRSSSWISSPIAPVATSGGPTSSGCCSRASPTRCLRRSAASGWSGTDMARAQAGTICASELSLKIGLPNFCGATASRTPSPGAGLHHQQLLLPAPPSARSTKGWQVELLFKWIKQHLRIKLLPVG